MTIQLYLVFPLLWLMLQRLGWPRFLLVTLAASLTVRTLGLWIFADVVPQWGYLDTWARGAIFITPHPGVRPRHGAGLARHDPPSSASTAGAGRPARWPWRPAPGQPVWWHRHSFSAAASPLVLLGAGGFILLFALLDATVVRSALAMRGVHFISKHSYAIFLMHFPVIALLVPHGTPVPRLLLLAAAAFTATLVLALLLEFATDRAKRLVAAAAGLSRGGKWRLAGALAAVWALLVVAELWVRQQDPQEVNGWGERSALQEDPRFGWRMIPDRTTRLRWQGYDYTITSNALGFPAPLYSAERPAGTFRIMTLGDAFTSAEGVDTEAAWPRLLERDLAAQEPGRPVQVQNFGVTGYGPNQYVAVARAFLPQFRPDALLVTMFVNEFDDAQKTDRQFRQSIGFGRTPADSVYAVLTLGHLSAWLQNNLRHIVSQLRGALPPMDAVHSQLKAFTASGGPADPEAQERVRHRFAELKSLAEENGVRLILLLVPANIQVCRTDEVYGASSRLDLGSGRLDLEQPQRVFAAEADTLGIEAIDLRPALRGAPCPYQRNNMHWTASGHQRVAAFVARLLDSRAHPAALDEAALPESPVPR
ncbi:MAG: GDSL-type esterase/lipase family protein [Rhodospirillales bacterium]